MSHWPAIVRDLMREQHMSERALSIKSRVCRSSLRNFFKHRTPASIDQLERILAVLGHELDTFPIPEAAKCQSAPQASAAAAASSPEASSAAINSNTTESAKPASTKPAHQPANVGTTPNGSGRAKPSSQQIQIARAAVSLRPSSITSPHIVATESSSGHVQTGNPSASPVTPDLSSPKNVAAHNHAILVRIAASFQVAA